MVAAVPAVARVGHRPYGNDGMTLANYAIIIMAPLFHFCEDQTKGERLRLESLNLTRLLRRKTKCKGIDGVSVSNEASSGHARASQAHKIKTLGCLALKCKSLLFISLSTYQQQPGRNTKSISTYLTRTYSGPFFCPIYSRQLSMAVEHVVISQIS